MRKLVLLTLLAAVHCYGANDSKKVIANIMHIEQDKFPRVPDICGICYFAGTATDMPWPNPSGYRAHRDCWLSIRTIEKKIRLQLEDHTKKAWPGIDSFSLSDRVTAAHVMGIRMLLEHARTKYPRVASIKELLRRDGPETVTKDWLEIVLPKVLQWTKTAYARTLIHWTVLIDQTNKL